MNTQDLSRLGFQEIHQLGNMLKAYAAAPILEEGVKWEYNPNSGNVCLVDDDFNVAMMNGNNLERHYNCPYCGFEGFAEDFKERKEKKHGEDSKTTFLACPDCEEAGRNPEEYLIEL